jgi:uncharacterized protein (TIGR03000 family)
MLRKCFLVPVVGCVAFLFVADMAQAQRDRRGGLRERRTERREHRQGVVAAPVVAPTSVEANPATRISNYYTPANEAAANVARIRVMLPDPQARVLFEDTATKQIGTDRLFITPPLTVGVASSYRVRASFLQNGREVVQERVVTVAPGMTYVLDFTQR